VPFGVQEGGAFGARHAPPAQTSAEFKLEQSGVVVVHEAKQNDPVEVLTHLLPEGQVLWSVALQAAVHTPPGNSAFGAAGVPAQISPAAVHPALLVQGFPRSALAGRPCAGQFAARMQAPKPAQHV
jgi:hypothetical protein